MEIKPIQKSGEVIIISEKYRLLMLIKFFIHFFIHIYST